MRWLGPLCLALCLSAGCVATAEERGLAETLLAALRHSTGFTDAQLLAAAQELLELPPSGQLPVWKEHVHCGPGTCSGEAAARVVVALAEAGKLPLRGFEPFPGDPLYKLWKLSDQTPFHSWVNGTADPSDAPLSTLVPEGQPLASGRFQAAEFARRAKRDMLTVLGLGPKDDTRLRFGRCLEWDTPFYTVKVFGEVCQRHDVLQYADSTVGHQQGMQEYPLGTRRLWLDVMDLPAWVPSDYGVIVCLFVMEHVPDPKAAMKGIASMLGAGGFLVLGAPFLDGVHGCPHDYFRYTPGGLRYIAEAAGLEVLRTYSPGDPVKAAGEFLGMKSSYWEANRILEESDTHPINVFLLARKPWSGRKGWRAAQREPAPRARPNRTLQWMRGAT